MSLHDKIIAAYTIDPDHLYDLTFLYDLLNEIGLTRSERNNFNSSWFGKKIKDGSIKIPGKPKPRSMWHIRGKDIEGIVRAFLPGGVGYYNYEENL